MYKRQLYNIPIIFPLKIATRERIKQIFLPMTSEIDETNIVRTPAIKRTRNFARTILIFSSQTRFNSELILLISINYCV